MALLAGNSLRNQRSRLCRIYENRHHSPDQVWLGPDDFRYSLPRPLRQIATPTTACYTYLVQFAIEFLVPVLVGASRG